MPRIDALPTTILPSRTHTVPAMKDGLTVQLTVGQLLDLVIGAAPGSLDTLDELAAALADDANYAATVTAALATKATTANLALATPVFGSVKLSLSGGNLLLSRERGSKLTIGGVPVVVPQAGVTLAPAGFTAGTLYYAYAAVVSGNVVLEGSTSAYAIDATTGQALKSGDASRTLVGMFRTIAGPVFSDTIKQRFVRSWFNDPGLKLLSSFSANRATTSVSTVELNSEIRCEMLLWAGEKVDATLVGSAINGATLGRNNSLIGVDGIGTVVSGTQSIMTSIDTVPFTAQTLQEGLSEGYHYVTMGASVNSGTGTWYGDSDGRRTNLKCDVSK
nr:hypothetical protein EVB34_054 [Rhizobium phage RHph_TM26]